RTSDPRGRSGYRPSMPSSRRSSVPTRRGKSASGPGRSAPASRNGPSTAAWRRCADSSGNCQSVKTSREGVPPVRRSGDGGGREGVKGAGGGEAGGAAALPHLHIVRRGAAAHSAFVRQQTGTDGWGNDRRGETGAYREPAAVACGAAAGAGMVQ